MHEVERLLAAFEEQRRLGLPAVLATLVRIEGSSYRRPGARALVGGDGSKVGAISGGCLETELRLRAREVLATGEPRLVAYDTGSEDDRLFGSNLGCGGQLEVLLEPLTPGSGEPVLHFLATALRQRRRGLVATVLRAPAGDPGEPRPMPPGPGQPSPRQPSPVRLGAHLLVGDDVPPSSLGDAELDARVRQRASAWLAAGAAARRSPWQSFATAAGEVELLFEPTVPPQPLWIFGSGHDVDPVLALAVGLGWEVTVAEPRDAPDTVARFTTAARCLAAPPEELLETLFFGALSVEPGTAALLMTHHYDHDLALLRELLRRPLAYLGLLGPKSRGDRLLAELRQEAGIQQEEGAAPWPGLDRLFFPVGLDLGAETPEAVALAIVAEIQAVLSGRQGGFLKDRRAPIHEPVAPPTDG